MYMQIYPIIKFPLPQQKGAYCHMPYIRPFPAKVRESHIKASEQNRCLSPVKNIYSGEYFYAFIA